MNAIAAAGEVLAANSRRVNAAIDGIKAVDAGYWDRTLAQRIDGNEGAAGSVVIGVNDSEELETALREAPWTPYPGQVGEGCTAFQTTAIGGQFGLIAVEDCGAPGDAVIRLDDRKGTGQLSCVVTGKRGATMDFTVIILGMEGDKEVVFTFHPGDTTTPSVVPAEPGLHGKVITVAEARARSFEYAKIVAA